jgi:hypothetical protein
MGRGLFGIGVLGGSRRVILILVGRWLSARSSGGILRLRDATEGGRRAGVVAVVVVEGVVVVVEVVNVLVLVGAVGVEVVGEAMMMGEDKAVGELLLVFTWTPMRSKGQGLPVARERNQTMVPFLPLLGDKRKSAAPTRTSSEPPSSL